jgi:hypothetical protein
MSEVLPRVTITTDVEARVFLSRVGKVLDGKRPLNVKLDPGAGRVAGQDILSIIPAASSSVPNLVGDLIADDPKGKRVRVEVRGRWLRGLPSHDAYVGAVRELFVPLVRAYNQFFKSRRRLHIPKRGSLEPTLPVGARSCFERFVKIANRAGLHDLDWERLYEFIWHCSLRRVGCDEASVRRMLTRAGFGDRMAGDIANVYYHGREIADRRPRY